MEYVLTFLVFVVVAGVTLTGYLVLAGRSRGMERRLQGKTPSDPSIGSSPELLLGDLTPALAGQLPLTEEDRSALQRDLRTAGYYRPTAVMEYAALRWVLVIIPLVAAGVSALFFTETLRGALLVWMAGVLVAGLGFSLPRIYLYYRAKSRMHAIERGLPTAIDMLTLCLGAGLNVLVSLRRVASELHGAYPILADELEIVGRQAELRTLEFSLAQFADRVSLPQARNIAVILNQSENLGTDAVTVLREYADNMRINMKQRAEEMANKAPFKLLFPAYMLAFGALILLFSPAILEASRILNTNNIGNTIRQAGEDIKKVDSANAGNLEQQP
jgi:tight adherence protein C